jgi:hypothetical protein
MPTVFEEVEGGADGSDSGGAAEFGVDERERGTSEGVWEFIES